MQNKTNEMAGFVGAFDPINGLAKFKKLVLKDRKKICSDEKADDIGFEAMDIDD